MMSNDVCNIYEKRMNHIVNKHAAFFGAVALLLTSLAYAGHDEAASDSLFHKTLKVSLDNSFEKVQSLARAFNEEQYAWRPAEGVRSVKESILHVAAANYFLGSKLGATMPEGLNPWTLEEEVEGKEATIRTLNESITFVIAAILATETSDLAEVIDLFGSQAPKMSAAFAVAEHANEHLGQLIAYARSVGVVPPWSK